MTTTTNTTEILVPEELKTYAEQRAIVAENLEAFSGIKLLHIKRQITLILNLIGRNGIFEQYTKHDISHINQMLVMLEWLIPDSTKKEMTSTDWLMIVLSIYFHDLGMLVTKEEYSQRMKSSFSSYRDRILMGEYGLEYKEKISALLSKSEDEGERFIYQEYVRHNHAKRIKYWIQGQQKDELGISDKIVLAVNDLLNHLPKKFRMDLGIICESHHLDDLGDFSKYPTSYEYGQSKQECVNIHYCALLLRTVDLLHITKDRTPSIEFKLIDPDDPFSQNEWIKQSAVSNVSAMIKNTVEGYPDEGLQKDTIKVTAYFDKPEKADAFFALIAYLIYAKRQVIQNYQWALEAQKKGGSKFLFPWKDINDDNVQTQGFERELFHFTLDQPRILNLLVGHTLYNDSTVVLRELIQNSFDAVRLYEAIEQKEEKNQIVIKWNSQNRKLEIIDTGTGMDRSIVENHLLKVGSSRYQDENFKKQYPNFSPISRFGIGILTCFMISNDIEITTTTGSEKDDLALNLNIRNVDGKYLLRYVNKDKINPIVKAHGTHICLKVRPEIDMDQLETNIRKWILFPPCNVILENNDKVAVKIGYDSPKAALDEYLSALNFDSENEVKVVEKELNGVKMAYAIRYSKYFQEWKFLEVTNHEREFSPIGVTIEGIRVEFSSPGFEGQRLYAIANATGQNAPKTNVARSKIERTDEKENLLTTIYGIYMKHVQSEIENLYKKNEFSITWAANEVSYLIEPFITSRGNDEEDYEYHSRQEPKSKPSSEKLLNHALNKLNAIIIENNKKREAVSVDFIQEKKKILTIDCDLHRSAESLIREVDTGTSLAKLLEALYGNEMEELNNNIILCGYRKDSRLHKNALHGMEVTSICIHPKKRRVDLTWENSSERKWIDLSSLTNRMGYSNLIVQNGKIDTIGLSKEIAVGSFGTIYLLSNNPFHKYYLSLMGKLDFKNSEDDSKIISAVGELALHFLRRSKTNVIQSELDTQLEYILEGSRKRAMNSIFWGKVNQAEFYDAVIKTNWEMFDTLAWSIASRGRYYS